MISLLQELCALDAPSSFEDTLRDFIREKAAPYADSMRTDSMGNLIVFKSGTKHSGNKLMLCAHMDEVALLIRNITEDGYLKFQTLGGIDRRVLIGKRVLVGQARLPGIIGIKAYHLGGKEEAKTTPKLSELYIDIGTNSREEAAALVTPGDYAVFCSSPALFGDGLIRAKALDDRIGCALLLSILQEPLPLDCHFVFTVQEEVGTRGAFGAAFSIQPEIALILEGTTAADLPDTDAHKRVCSPGLGPVIPFMDGATMYDRRLFELLRDLAKTHDIPWQTKHFIAGGTDAGAIQRSRAGVRVAGISAAVRYLHTANGLASTKDIEAMRQLTLAFLEAIAAEQA